MLEEGQSCWRGREQAGGTVRMMGGGGGEGSRAGGRCLKMRKRKGSRGAGQEEDA
jgi:hypothetical protein